MTTTTPDQTVININDNVPTANTDVTTNEATNSSTSHTNTTNGDTTLNLEATPAATNVDNMLSNLETVSTDTSTIPSTADTSLNLQPTSTNTSTIPTIADGSSSSQPILTDTHVVDKPLTDRSTPTITLPVDKPIAIPTTPTITPFDDKTPTSLTTPKISSSFDKPITSSTTPTNTPIVAKSIPDPFSTTSTSTSGYQKSGATALTSTPSDDKPITFEATPLKTTGSDTSNVKTTSPETVVVEDATTPKPSEDALLLDELNKIGETMKKESTKNGFIAATVCAGLCGSSLMICWLSIIAIIPLLKLIIGWHYADQCPISWRIPHYLVIAGAVGLAVSVLTVIKPCFGLIGLFESGNFNIATKITRIISILTGVANIFLIIWFILGCIWVFRVWNKVQYKDPNAANYCHATLYRFAYWLLFISIGFYACICCGSVAPARELQGVKKKGRAKPAVTTEP